MESIMFNRELKKGSTELLVLSLLDQRARHGYEIGKLIEMRSGGKLSFRIGSLYPILCRLEDRGLITGRWGESGSERRRRYYKLTAEGRRVLARERGVWREFVLTVNRVASARS
jgi:transcriptional regulator